jgi:alkylhydroperoxidase family enzyme
MASPMLAREPIEIEWSDSLLPPPPPSPMTPALTARAQSVFGPVPAWVDTLHWCPWVVEAMLDGITVRLVHIDLDLVAQLRLVVAQENSCRYCYGTARLMLRTLGFSREFVRALERDLIAAHVTPRDRAALDYARLLSRADPRPGTAQARVLIDAGFSAEAVAEIAGITAMWLMATRITTLLAVPPAPEAETERWWARVAQPLIERTLRRQAREFPLVASDPARRIAALDPVIAPFGDLPAGASLRKILDAALAEGPLPRRTRLIVSAVIGRALGCDVTLRLLEPLLAADGIEPAAADAMLAQLDADWLDERERLLLHAARDTVHVRQPRLVQRRMQEVRERLDPAEFIDFVGVAAIANGLARLGTLLQRC